MSFPDPVNNRLIYNLLSISYLYVCTHVRTRDNLFPFLILRYSLFSSNRHIYILFLKVCFPNRTLDCLRVGSEPMLLCRATVYLRVLRAVATTYSNIKTIWKARYYIACQPCYYVLPAVAGAVIARSKVIPHNDSKAMITVSPYLSSSYI